MEYSDFCVRTFNGNDTGIHIEHILKDKQLWNDCVINTQTFFKTCVLQELLGSWYTDQIVTLKQLKPISRITDTSSAQLKAKCCYYSGPDERRMIGCDSNECAIEYCNCLKIATIPHENGTAFSAENYL